MINKKDIILLFLEKTITEKNLTISTVNSYKNDLTDFCNYLKKNNLIIFYLQKNLYLQIL